MKKFFFPTCPDLSFTARSPLFGNNFQNMNPKKVKIIPQKGNWSSYQLFKISQQNAKNWIFRNLLDIDLYPAGTLGPLGVNDL